MTLACDLKVSMKNRPTGFIGELTKRLRIDVKEDTPVDTGRLQSGWRARGSKTGVIEMWNDTEYGVHVNARGKHRNFASCAHIQRLANRLAKDVQEDLE